MKLHQLVYFLETAKHEHIGRAAKILAISPSAISHSITSLEEELGRQLFVKQGKRILLSNHGKLLFERVSKLMGEIDTLKEEIASDQVELQGHYRLAASHLVAPTILAPAWASVQENHPKLVGEIYTLRSAQVLSGVIDGEFDLGVCFNPQSHPAVTSKSVHEGKLVVCVNKGHPILKARGLDRITRLSGYPATLPKSYQGIDNCQTHPVFEKFGIVPVPDLIFDNYEVAIQKLKLSRSWGFLPDWIVRQSGLVPIVPEGWDAPVTLTVLWPKNRILTRVMQRLMESVEDLISRISS